MSYCNTELKQNLSGRCCKCTEHKTSWQEQFTLYLLYLYQQICKKVIRYSFIAIIMSLCKRKFRSIKMMVQPQEMSSLLDKFKIQPIVLSDILWFKKMINGGHLRATVFSNIFSSIIYFWVSIFSSQPEREERELRRVSSIVTCYTWGYCLEAQTEVVSSIDGLFELVRQGVLSAMSLTKQLDRGELFLTFNILLTWYWSGHKCSSTTSQLHQQHVGY